MYCCSFPPRLIGGAPCSYLCWFCLSLFRPFTFCPVCQPQVYSDWLSLLLVIENQFIHIRFRLEWHWICEDLYCMLFICYITLFIVYKPIFYSNCVGLVAIVAEAVTSNVFPADWMIQSTLQLLLQFYKQNTRISILKIFVLSRQESPNPPTHTFNTLLNCLCMSLQTTVIWQNQQIVRTEKIKSMFLQKAIQFLARGKEVKTRYKRLGESTGRQSEEKR